MRSHEFIDEGWRSTAAGLAAAAALGAGGTHLYYKNAEEPRNFSQTAQKPYHGLNIEGRNPVRDHLIHVAYNQGLRDMELAHFIAQAAHETGNFTRLKEQGNSRYFHKYDPQYAPKTAKILGNVRPGDGEKYRGRGYLQITGRYNYRKAGEALGLPLEQQPELLEKPDIAAQASIWYWNQRVRPRVPDFEQASVQDVTKPINAGLRGLSDRQQKFEKITLGN